MQKRKSFQKPEKRVIKLKKNTKICKKRKKHQEKKMINIEFTCENCNEKYHIDDQKKCQFCDGEVCYSCIEIECPRCGRSTMENLIEMTLEYMIEKHLEPVKIFKDPKFICNNFGEENNQHTEEPKECECEFDERKYNEFKTEHFNCDNVFEFIDKLKEICEDDVEYKCGKKGIEELVNFLSTREE